MNCFIVRPFGTKQDVNFDAVEELLIQPALKLAGITGSTTGAILEAGNIREDMFSKLLTADLVVADVSIHNANVFYELGIRHSLRDKKTFLIRCSKDEIPFDLKTDRYFTYNTNDLAAGVAAMASGLKATILSERQDSPVFYMLPKLEAQDPERFLAVPPDFSEEVDIAKAGRQTGKLALLADETEGFDWEIPGLRKVGEEQFSLKALEDAQITWEKIRDYYPNDLEANDLLATIYQRMAEATMASKGTADLELLAKSDAAIKRLLTNIGSFERSKQAEIYSLRARNGKTRWVDAWDDGLTPEERRSKALKSSFLLNSFTDYEWGYKQDLNHFYSGINAVALLTMLIILAESQPEVWAMQFDTEEDASYALKKHKEHQQRLATVVQVCVDAEQEKLKQQGKTNPWLSITEADLACLTSKRPERVGSLYRQALSEAGNLNVEAPKRQLHIYEQLNILPENVKAALAEFEVVQPVNIVEKTHYILFTGHMLDKPGRVSPRFPVNKEAAARAAIKEAVQKEKDKIDGPVCGIAGGACGGDILFHEVCEELGIATELYLAIPREQFLVTSVQFAGADWVERFNTLYKKLPRKLLAQTKEMPNWLQKKPDYTIWERNNLWMLHNALVCGGLQLSLIALWDGKGGDGKGGTQHMVSVAQERGAKTNVIDTNKIFT